MPQALRISPDFTLPLDWMSLRTVVYGNSGSGKTMLGRVLAEETHRIAQRFVAIDIKGDWWGLRTSADGKAPGIPVVIFGGDHADVPLEPDAGEWLGETVAKMSQSVILDLEHLTKGQQVRFLAKFFLALYHHNREPLVVFLDESQRAHRVPEARPRRSVEVRVRLVSDGVICVLRSCAVCRRRMGGRTHTLCDFPATVETAPSIPEDKRCSKSICHSCSVKVGPDLHWCKTHAPPVPK